ncbi:hypothetical protein [uncultured Desulfobacter sp.]|nr:hypothetical protein [uncultured Desulfobacter sp.]
MNYKNIHRSDTSPGKSRKFKQSLILVFVKADNGRIESPEAIKQSRS